MKYLLDTNVASDYLRGVTAVVKKIQQATPSELAISSITVMELCYGAARRHSATLSAAVDAFIAGITVVAFDAEAGERAGVVRAILEAKGIAIALADCQIAAIALRHGLSLVSNDTVFKRVPKLSVVDWRRGRT